MKLKEIPAVPILVFGIFAALYFIFKALAEFNYWGI